MIQSRQIFRLFLLIILNLAVLIYSAAGQWRWSNPKPQSNDLWNISFAPGTTSGWAVGAAGMIIRTTDDGSTWNTQESGTENFLRGVSAVNAQTAWAAGDFGTVLKTSNGGATWIRLTVSTTEGINQIHAVSASDLWFAGDLGMLYRSTNGGATWGTVASGVSINLNDIFFSDASHGWCVGSSKTIIHTTNGGGTWSNQNVTGPSSHLIGVFFIDNSNGWAAGTGGTILRTTNGGANWARLQSATSTDVNKVLFHASGAGLAVGENGLVIGSVNWGQSWSSVSSQTTSGLEGLAISGSNVVAVGIFGEILRSTNLLTIAPVLIGDRSTWNAISCGAFTAWAVGAQGAIMATTNGGVTWSVQSSGTQNALFGVKGLNALTAWACGSGGILLKTTDGGARWLPQSSGTGVALNGIDFVNAQLGWSVGVSGKIIRSTDGGTSWQPQASGTLQPLYGIDMQDSQRGTIVGGNGVILQTTNGGTSWTPQASYTGDALFSVVRQGQDGWISGDAGTILRTSDGGQNWDTTRTNTAVALFTVVRTAPDFLFAAGENGVILQSSDRGSNWSRSVTHTTYTFYGACVYGGTAYAAGEYGMVLVNNSYPTPVTFISFRAGRVDDVVELSWRTTDEKNNHGFDIQMYTDPGWISVGFVEAFNVDTEYHEYTFTHRIQRGAADVVRYRLKQIDTDGSYSYSSIVEVGPGDTQEQDFRLESASPNPFLSETTISISFAKRADSEIPATLQIFTLDGKKILDLSGELRGIRSGQVNLVLTADRFPRSGVYILRLAGGQQVVLRKLVHLK